MLRIEDFWDMEQYFKAVRAPFYDQVTMATKSLSGDVKQWWRTRYEDVLEGRCEINAWEELNRELKERSISSGSPLILGKLVAACEFFQGKGRPDSTLFFTLIRSRLHLRNTPEGNFALLPSIFTLRHADSPFVIRRGIRPRGISIGTSPSDFARRRSRHSPRAMGKDVDRSP
ncbi:hypothetical protein FNV43_RR08304 [Rhamnella rubrinervis]|uniref:Retrotransposon gag domain-containing protein n=1 Tax=Rhamnella rubrinervis TaxID=2594499 RepID=A0A8K0HGA4_9ROSA|nr:hypothetical protein FNV43_RR08304 [Rhamnella rubrinervis]